MPAVTKYKKSYFVVKGNIKRSLTLVSFESIISWVYREKKTIRPNYMTSELEKGERNAKCIVSLTVQKL